MKAAVYTRYGPPEVLRLEEVAYPEPKADELLVKVHATAVSSGECTLRSMKGVSPLLGLAARLMFGVFRPRNPRPGAEFAGVVKAVGDEVTKFEPGHRVFGSTAMRGAAHAEYLRIAEAAAVVRTPESMTDQEAAALPFGALSALHFLKFGGIEERPGQRVLVVGAGGALGSAAVQLAKYYGAHITGVCSGGKADLVRTLGAHEVIDYTQQDFSRGDGRYDLIFDTVDGCNWAQAKRVLEPGGRFVNAVFGLRKLGLMVFTSVFGKYKVICTVSGESAEDLAFLKSLVEKNHLKAVIGGLFALADIVEAHRHVEDGHKTGAVVLTVLADD